MIKRFSAATLIFFLLIGSWILCTSSILCISSVFADAPDFYMKHTEGWHWYQDPIQPIRETTSVNPQNTLPSQLTMHPIEQMQQLHHLLKQALDRAILNPTTANVRNYMMLQNQVTQRASLFTARWKAVLLQDPHLDYSILHPTSSLGRQIYLTQVRQQQDQAIRYFAQQQGFFFFYRGDCPYCHRFAPILKAFTEHYGIHVIPISVGGGFLPEFPQSRLDQGQAVLLHVSVYPSLFAVNPITQKIIPVAYGLISEVALRQRILEMVASLNRPVFQTLSFEQRQPNIAQRSFQ